METVLLTRFNCAFDMKLAAPFVREGYEVFAVCRGGNGAVPARMPEGAALLPDNLAGAAEIINNKTGKIDIYVELSDARSSADNFTVRGGVDEITIRALYEENVLRPMASLEAFISLLDAGEKKRLCFITSADASINETRRVDGYGYAMGKAAMSNFYQMISNKLAPSGYTFRVYDPMPAEIDAEASAEGAFKYFTRRRGTENNDPNRDDETILALRDANGRHHSW
jgi:NAD(P)-dependent dehydrogenase (short-subunit alcohol dehydrogenase family)